MYVVPETMAAFAYFCNLAPKTPPKQTQTPPPAKSAQPTPSPKPPVTPSTPPSTPSSAPVLTPVNTARSKPGTPQYNATSVVQPPQPTRPVTGIPVVGTPTRPPVSPAGINNNSGASPIQQQQYLLQQQMQQRQLQQLQQQRTQPMTPQQLQQLQQQQQQLQLQRQQQLQQQQLLHQQAMLQRMNDAFQKITGIIEGLKDEGGRQLCELFLDLPSREDYPDYYQVLHVTLPYCTTPYGLVGSMLRFYILSVDYQTAHSYQYYKKEEVHIGGGFQKRLCYSLQKRNDLQRTEIPHL